MGNHRHHWKWHCGCSPWVACKISCGIPRTARSSSDHRCSARGCGGRGRTRTPRPGWSGHWAAGRGSASVREIVTLIITLINRYHLYLWSGFRVKQTHSHIVFMYFLFFRAVAVSLVIFFIPGVYRICFIQIFLSQLVEIFVEPRELPTKRL